MIITKTPTREETVKVFLDKENYNRAADDRDPTLEEFNVEWLFNDKLRIVGAYIEHEIVGIGLEHDNELHFMLLRQYRKYGHEVVEELMLSFPGEVITKVPFCYPSTLHFAKKHGFVEVGVEKDAFKKNGEFYDEHILRRS